MVENFQQKAHTRVFKGGRGSAKTRGLALMSAVYVVKMWHAGKEGVFLCSREFMNSLEESSMEEIKQAIRETPAIAAYFDIGEKYIRTKDKKISYVFAGLRHNLDSIKSKARILGNWTDEAEKVSEVAWQKLLPTIRDDDAENWVSYNPESPESATHKRFVENAVPGCIVTTMNWRDNPWFPGVLNRQRLEDQRLRPDIYEHVWEGEFLTITEAQIFQGKFEIKEFEPTDEWDGPYHGLDFGFSQDPTAGIQAYVHDSCLYIRKEAIKKRLELDDTARFIGDKISGFSKHCVRADSARPESISYLKRHGMPFMEGVKKWKGSVEDGIEFIKSFERVYIHPDCPETAREFRLYSYKVDEKSGDVLPRIIDKYNHCIDALRYSLAPLILGKRSIGMLLKRRYRK